MPVTINKNYPAQVWITSVIIGSLILTISTRNYDAQFIMLSLVLSALYSMPALLVYFIAFKILAAVPASVFFIKLLLAMVAITGICITFYMLHAPFPKHLWDWSFYLLYSIAILISSFAFRIRKQKSAPAGTKPAERYKPTGQNR